MPSILPAAALLLALGLSQPALAAEKPNPLAGTSLQQGLLPVHLDANGGRILLQLPAPGADGVSARLLYLVSLRTGLGSAPIGLDRAQPGPSRILAIRRLGKKIAFELENPRFRATGAPEAEQAAARDAFATSTLWLGDAIPGPGGTTLVDIAPFLTRDAKDIFSDLRGGGEKGWKLAPDLSAADPGATKVFPDNLEFEAKQTYISETPGPEVRNIAPDPRAISFTVRHSFIRLPELNAYTPRRFDPRGGAFATETVDFATPLGQPIAVSWANRFRLEKTDPTAARSTVKKPIIFHIDRAAPEPIRTALLEGARWWAQAFEAAGYIDAYRAEILPEGIDPLDVRYNVVNWVNRATRGWSYGAAVTDPRTGEILKGSVLLGSLRVRQDILIYEGLVGAANTGKGGPNDPAEVALARIRQLSAHEIGHSLGLLHNFAGSTQDRASVMDYPAPRVTLVNGAPDLSDAYGVGLGSWDRFAINWLYANADAATAGDLRYVSDEQSRNVAGAHPHGSLWDDGADPVAELQRQMTVRRAAVDRFGLAALAPNEPVANLRRKFVPIWLLHRYQVEAAAKLIGGADSRYAVNGAGGETAQPVPAAAQRAALSALLATLSPAALEVPPSLVPLMSAGNTESDRQFDIEILPTNGGTVFDPLAATDAASTVTILALLNPQRLNRLNNQPGAPSPSELVNSLLNLPAATGRLAEVQRNRDTRILLNLAKTIRDPALEPALALQLDQQLTDHAKALATRPAADAAQRRWNQATARLLLDREALTETLAKPESFPPVPPGMPIGSEPG